MENNSSLVKIPLIILGIAIVASVLWSIFRPQPPDQTMAPTDDTMTTTQPAPTANDTATMMCYYSSTKQAHGYDKASVTLSITGNAVTGEYHTVPAEKDASNGTFTGTTTTDPNGSISKIATVWADTTGEGMQSKNQLLIIYDDAKAALGYGEMTQVANSDSTQPPQYTYKDITKVTYGTAIPKIDCNTLSEINAVEGYIKDNIKTIVGTTTAPVLGGQWYTTSINVDPSTHTANISYEDGHIANKATAQYAIDASSTITISNFTPIK